MRGQGAGGGRRLAAHGVFASGLLLGWLRSGILRHGVLGGQLEVVVNLLQFLQMIFLQTDEALQFLAVLPGAVQTVDHVAPLLLPDEQHPEHLNLALTAEVGRLRPRPAMELELAALRPDKLHSDHHLAEAPQQSVLHGLEQFTL